MKPLRGYKFFGRRSPCDMAYFSAFIYGVFAFFLGRLFPLFTTFLSLLLLFSLRRTGWLRLVVMLLITIGGFLYAGSSYSPPCQPSLLAGKSFEIEAEPVSLARELEGSGLFSQAVRVVRPEGWPEQVRLIASAPLPPDKICRLVVSVSRDAALSNPGTGREVIAAYLQEMGGVDDRQGTVILLDFFRAQRTRLNAFMRDRLSPETAPFLMSIVTGERGLITEDLRDSFSRTGLVHILSISGAHFGLLLFVIFRFSLAAIRRLPYRVLVRLTTFLTPSQVAALVCVPFMVFYLGISSINIPALRAFIMVSLFLLGLMVQREGFWLNTLLFAATVILLMSPGSVLDLSFQLSFVSVLAIGLVSERWIRKEEPQEEKQKGLSRLLSAVLSYLRASLIISLAATIATAPLVAWHFHYFSVVSPITNLVFTPIIGFVILPLSLLSSFFYLIFGVFPFLAWLDGFTGFVLSAIELVSRWGWADLKLPSYPLIVLMAFYAGLGMYLFLAHTGDDGAPKGRRPFALFIPLAVSITPLLVYVCLSLFYERGMRVTYLDTGQGDAAVAELPDGRTVVMDTGRRGFQVENFLRYRGITELEAIVLSHGQADHVGGAMRLMREFHVSEVWDNGRLVYAGGLPEGVRHRPLQRGDTIRGEGYRITALHPYDGFYTMSPSEDEENNDCLVLRIEGEKSSFLFAGDIEEEAEENLSLLQEHLRSDVLKVPHHGSSASASAAFLTAVSPKIAVISVGRGNPYGHPHQETLDLLAHATVMRTDRSGAVSVRELPDGRLEIKSWKDSGLREAHSLQDECLNTKKLFWVW